MTYTYAILTVSQATYDEVRAKLEVAGYGQAFHDDEDGPLIDMHGIALQAVSAMEQGMPAQEVTLPVAGMAGDGVVVPRRKAVDVMAETGIATAPPDALLTGSLIVVDPAARTEVQAKVTPEQLARIKALFREWRGGDEERPGADGSRRSQVAGGEERRTGEGELAAGTTPPGEDPSHQPQDGGGDAPAR